MNPTDTLKPSELFQARRNDPAFHLGLGDIRLTLADQEEIEREIAELQRDRERIDWMEATNQRGHYCGDFAGNLLTRAAIDRAMQPKEETKP
jgi:hypothetical protein